MINTKTKITLVIASLLALFAVVLGAFGAHGLKDLVSVERLATWQTAVDYQFFTALGILILGLYERQYTSVVLRWAMYLLLVGVLIFSGSLYILVLMDMPWLGMFTPIGGVIMILGWMLFVIYLTKQPASLPSD